MQRRTSRNAELHQVAAQPAALRVPGLMGYSHQGVPIPQDPSGAHEAAPPPEADPVIQQETRPHPNVDDQG